MADAIAFLKYMESFFLPLNCVRPKSVRRIILASHSKVPFTRMFFSCVSRNNLYTACPLFHYSQ
jgi:hypothetical protein